MNLGLPAKFLLVFFFFFVKIFESNISKEIFYIYKIRGFFEVAIESWPECDLNPRPLNSVMILLLGPK